MEHLESLRPDRSDGNTPAGVDQPTHEPHLVGKLTSMLGLEERKHVDAPPLSTSQPVSGPAKHEGLFGRIGDAVAGSDNHPSAPGAAPVAKPAPDSTKHENLIDRVYSALGQPHTAAQALPPPPPETIKHESLLDKVSSTLGSQRPAEVHASALPPAEAKKHEGIVDKISSALGEQHTSQAQTSAPIPPASDPKHAHLLDKLTGAHSASSPAPLPAPPKHEGVGEKIADAFGVMHHSTSVPPTQPPTQPAPHGLLHKLSGVFEGEEQRKQEQEAERKHLEEAAKAQHHRLGVEDVFDKLGLGHQPEPLPPKEESLLDKLGSGLHHQQEAPAPTKQSLADKIESTIRHRKEDPPPQGMSDKIASVFGFGSASEKNEDDLDKAIDFVQEHILRQGTQSHESFLEQMKDEQIARTIRAQYRSATGHEFPLKSGHRIGHHDPK